MKNDSTNDSAQEMQQRLDWALQTYDLALWEFTYPAQTLLAGRSHLLLGYEEQEAPAGMDWWIEQTHPDDLPESRKAWEMLRDGEVNGSDCCVRFRHKDGSYRWLHRRAEAVEHDASGHALRIIGTLRDVTEQKLAEAARSDAERELNESQARYRTMLESQMGMVCRWRPDTTITYVNEAYANLVGQRPQELLGKKWTQFVQEDRRHRVEEIIQKLLRQKTRTQHEQRLVLPDGGVRWVQWTNWPILNEAGEVIEVHAVGADITALKQTEEALREREEIYSRIFELESDAMFLFDTATGAILEANAAAAQLYGYAPEEWRQLNQLDLSAEPEASCQSVATREERVFGRWHRRKDGTRFPVEIASRFFTMHGRAVHIGAVRDVTNQLKAQEEIERQRLFLRQVIDANPNFIYVKDEQGRFVLANQKMIETFGVRSDSLLGQTVRDIMPEPEIHIAMEQDDLEILTGRAERIEHEERFIDGRGNLRWCWTVKLPLRDEDGVVRRVIGTSQDITEEKEAELALRESEEQFAQFMGNIDAVIIIADENHRLVYANPYFEKIIGFRDWQGKLPSDFFPPDVAASLIDGDDEALRTGSSRRNMIVPGVDGVMHQHEVHCFLIQRPGRGPLIGGIALDVTNLKQAEEERARLEQQLLQAMKMEAVGHLAGGVAHDFNNLLSPILGYADMALMRLNESDSLYGDLKQIRDAAERGASLTRQLLAFSRKQVLDARVLCLNRTVAEFVGMIRRLIGEDIVVATSLEPKLWRVKADAAQVQQMLMNLAINARDAMPGGGTLIFETSNVEIDEAYSKGNPGVKPGPYALLSINDTGIGMDQEVKQHVFEPFFTTKERGKGTGLGLSTVYGMVKQHGGHITVYSEQGRGTTFRIYLPRVEQKLATSMPKSRSQAIGGTETILVVEDEELVRNLTLDVLKSHGYEVLVASNGAEALQKQAEFGRPIDLLLTDVIMPGMNGKELYQQFAQARPQTPVLYMSGYIDQVITQEGLLQPTENFLQKPFAVMGLLQKVRAVLDQQPRESQCSCGNSTDD